MANISPTRRVGDTWQTMLGVYLNDHVAGSTGGLELARRLARQHRGSASGPHLDRLAAEIAEDRAALLDMMATLGIPVKRYKVCAGWAAEKATRLKPNARAVRRSSLSTVIELESMRLGVQGKLMAWQALRTLASGVDRLDADRLEALMERARQQSGLLEDLRIQAVSNIFMPA